MYIGFGAFGWVYPSDDNIFILNINMIIFFLQSMSLMISMSCLTRLLRLGRFYFACFKSEGLFWWLWSCK